MPALDIAKLYFELSNKSDLEAIEPLLTETTTYSSQTTGIYLGASDIIQMQRDFHSKFTTLHWNIDSVKEVKPGIVRFDFTFTGKMPNGDTVESSGHEYVIVHHEKTQHIEIRNSA